MAITTRVGTVLMALVLAATAMLVALVGPLAKPAKTQGVAPSTLTGESLEAQTSIVDPPISDLEGEVTVEPH